MRDHTHAVIGACACVPLAILLGGSVMLPICAAAGAIGAVLPDIDHPRSTLGRWAPWPAVAVTNHRTGFVAHGRRWFGGYTVWHRGETHSICAAGIAVLATLGIGRWLFGATFAWLQQRGAPPVGNLPEFAWGLAAVAAAAVLVGYLSHLVADMANPSPQMLWWPLSRRMVHPRWAPAIPEASAQGQWLEHGAVVAAIVLAMLLWGGRPV